MEEIEHGVRGKKRTLVIVTHIKIQNTALSICRGVADPLETQTHNHLKDSYKRESYNHYYSL